ncbi:MAG TPA: hypothetical protein VE395_01410 [Acidimicrobiales bacterium]|nr:hypothetical protein [Acidimicrobiales bacterium]
MLGPRQLAGRAGRVYRSAVVRRKSGPWKDPHHQGRALIECLELLHPGPSAPASGPI